ncbi:MAG: hypothetical protein GDA44_08455 [Prochloron sp. SP5CPC1]|nr:hypothetical protein [Candidatus Paraprochloron terpiosi SP5CPC1]
MKSIKLVNHIILCLVAFSTSFALGLVGYKENLKDALVTGLITIPASSAGLFVANKRRIAEEKQSKSALHHQIKVLEKQKAELSQSVSSATIIQQELEASTKSLQAERERLLERITELHWQRNEFYLEIRSCEQEKLHQEQAFYHRQQQLEKILSVKNRVIYPTQTKLNLLRQQLEFLQSQVAEKQKHREQLNQYFTTLERNLEELEGQKYDLHTQIKVLEQRENELNRKILQLNYTISQLREEKERIQTSLIAGEEALELILTKIANKQKRNKQLQ